MHNKKLFTFFALILALLLLLVFYRLVQTSIYLKGDENFQLIDITDAVKQTVYEQVELKNQDDFKMIGKEIFIGSGAEPGFTLKISLAGNSFGTEIISAYGESRYVGYLNLITQSTSTKIFSGKLLDNKNNAQDAKIVLTNKKCVKSSGEISDYQLNIKVSKESLTGCADIVLK